MRRRCAAQQRLRDQLAAGARESSRPRTDSWRRRNQTGGGGEGGGGGRGQPRLRGELAEKEKALSRALTKYKEEVGKFGERIRTAERSKRARGERV